MASRFYGFSAAAVVVINENMDALQTLTSADYTVADLREICGWLGPRDFASDAEGN